MNASLSGRRLTRTFVEHFRHYSVASPSTIVCDRRDSPIHCTDDRRKPPQEGAPCGRLGPVGGRAEPLGKPAAGLATLKDRSVGRRPAAVIRQGCLQHPTRVESQSVTGGEPSCREALIRHEFGDLAARGCVGACALIDREERRASLGNLSALEEPDRVNASWA